MAQASEASFADEMTMKGKDTNGAGRLGGEPHVHKGNPRRAHGAAQGHSKASVESSGQGGTLVGGDRRGSKTDLAGSLMERIRTNAVEIVLGFLVLGAMIYQSRIAQSRSASAPEVARIISRMDSMVTAYMADSDTLKTELRKLVHKPSKEEK